MPMVVLVVYLHRPWRHSIMFSSFFLYLTAFRYAINDKLLLNPRPHHPERGEECQQDSLLFMQLKVPSLRDLG